MKIKTITCHDVYNVGASLQAYALQTYLKKLGHEVEIIDYKPLYLQRYSLKKVDNPKYDKPLLKQIYLLLKFPKRIKELRGRRKSEFDDFTQKFLSLTSKRYETFEELKNNPPIADVFFAGSDQIWNTLFKNGRDPAFYLKFVPNTSIKASYAASFATEQIENEYRERVKEWISTLDYISVRESSGISILNEIGIKDAQLVLDPVFLLNKKEWEKLIDKKDNKEKYVFVYDFEQNPKIIELARKIAEKNKMKLYSFLENIGCDKVFKDEGPLKFLSLIYNAEYVVSNSFHATVFSLIFNKPFAVFDRVEGINTRMNDLISLVGLEKRNDIVEYERVNCILGSAIENSKVYIQKVLDEAEKRVR